MAEDWDEFARLTAQFASDNLRQAHRGAFPYPRRVPGHPRLCVAFGNDGWHGFAGDLIAREIALLPFLLRKHEYEDDIPLRIRVLGYGDVRDDEGILSWAMVAATDDVGMVDHLVWRAYMRANYDLYPDNDPVTLGLYWEVQRAEAAAVILQSFDSPHHERVEGVEEYIRRWNVIEAAHEARGAPPLPGRPGWQ